MMMLFSRLQLGAVGLTAFGGGVKCLAKTGRCTYVTNTSVFCRFDPRRKQLVLGVSGILSISFKAMLHPL